MSGLLVAAMVWPVLALAVGLALARFLRSADRMEEQRRCTLSSAAFLVAGAPQQAGGEDRRVSAAMGIGG